MKKKLKIIFVLLFLCFSVSLFNIAFAGPAETEETKDLAIQLSSALGGTVSGLPQFIERIYNWLIAIAGGVATVMLMLGGFIYLTAMGNPTQIGKAKEMISNAVIGLFLALGAFLILNTINPAILNLKMPGIKKITGKPIKFEEAQIGDCTIITNRTDCEQREDCVWLSMEVFSAAQAGRITGTLFNWVVRAFTSLEGDVVGRKTGEAVGEWLYPSGVREHRGGCVRPDPDIGTDGHACRRTDPPCNGELRCLEVSTIIIGNSRRLCSSGGANSPCRTGYAGQDCFGITPTSERVCHSYMCMGATDRPQGAPCTDNSQCASNRCVGGNCAFGEGEAGSECRPGPGRDNDDLCNEGIFCCTTSAEDRALCEIERPTCVTKFRPGHNCAEGYQCTTGQCSVPDGRDYGMCCGGDSGIPCG